MPIFEIGNKAALKWTEEEVRSTFNQMMVNATDDESILCMQDAIASVGLYKSSVDYLIEKFPDFGTLKEDINSIIISRINKGALLGTYVSTPSIWRMKQLGEKDSSEVNHQNDGGKFDTPRIVFKKDYE